MLQVLILYVIVMNIFGFYMMWSDKRKARRDAWRTPERNFFIVSLLGGSIGWWAGMYVFHHKTQHIKFTVGIPVVLLLQISVLLWLVSKMVPAVA